MRYPWWAQSIGLFGVFDLSSDEGIRMWKMLTKRFHPKEWDDAYCAAEQIWAQQEGLA